MGILLARSAPSAQRVDAGAVVALLDRLDAMSVECHSIMVVRHGHVVAEGWWRPFSADRPHLLYSLTKSFTSIAVGWAVTDGLLALDDRVVDVLPDHVPQDVQAPARQLTLHHLLSMTTGHREDTLLDAWALEPKDLVKGFLRVPIADPPGTRHTYNNSTTFVLARMVERVTGRDLAELLDERLLQPMGIKSPEWDRVGGGATFGFQGLHLTTEAVAAFGELLLRGGRWHDRQLVPREWVELATTRHIDTLQVADGSRTADWLQGYGYQFWMSQHGFRGDGALGQFCLVIPEHDLVVVMTAATGDMQAALDAVWGCLLPGLDSATADEAADSLAAQRLRELSLPLIVGADNEDRPAQADNAVAAPLVASAHGDDRFSQAVFAAVDAESPLPPGTSVAVEPKAGGWLLRLDTGETRFELEVGHGDWRESAPLGRPVMAAGAWQGTAFVADLYVINGPHRIRLTLDGGRATAIWNVPPLVGPDLLRQLRSPLMTRPDAS